ncbi:PREDICTED: transmembrane protein 205-like [Nicotiana attenuata]|uniref:transmembrane protein 205-like n=1 Tax=Nicotiana attenuata TaxID=49451 RepID=UPI000905BC87|nr:PREDICTED: transmembrane protein 205-like [Nicotiana attenuata]
MGWMTRFLAAVAFLAIGVLFSPETFGSKSEGQHPPKLVTLLKLAHLLCFSTAFGAALWVTFIGGIIMFKTSHMMKERHKIEREANIGEEVGWTKNQEVAKANPKLAAMNKKFGMIHGLSSLANIFSFGCLAMHSWYLAGKLNL